MTEIHAVPCQVAASTGVIDCMAFETNPAGTHANVEAGAPPNTVGASPSSGSLRALVIDVRKMAAPGWGARAPC